MLLTKRARTLANLAHMCRVREEEPSVLITLDADGYRVWFSSREGHVLTDMLTLLRQRPWALLLINIQKMFPALLLNFDLRCFP